MVAMAEPPENSSQEAPPPLRVGVVASRPSLANLGSVVRHLIVGMLDAPTAVTFVCPDDADVSYLPDPLVQTVRYQPTRLPFLRGRSLAAAAGRLRAANVSLLHALDADALPGTRHLATRLDIDYLVGVYSLRRPPQISDPHCQAVLAASEPIRKMLVDAHAAPADMVHLLRPSVHQARNATCFIDPSHAVSIVAAGEMKTLGPFAAVLEAFAELRQARRECVFFLIGTGQAERAVRKLAEDLRLLGEVTFVDPTRPGEITGILKAADIFISPASSERVDIQLLAAMAGGVPVLAAANGADDFVIPDQTALTFPGGSAGELTVKLKALLDDRAAARAMAESALAHLRAHHSPAKVARQLVEIYRSILGRVRAEV